MKMMLNTLRIFGTSFLGALAVTTSIVAIDNVTQTYASVGEEVQYELSSYEDYEVDEDLNFDNLRLQIARQEEYESEDREHNIIDIMLGAKEINLDSIAVYAEEHTTEPSSVEEIVEESYDQEEVIYENGPVPGVALNDEQAVRLAMDNAIAYHDYSARVFELINEYRQENGLAPLSEESTLTLIASHRSTENAWVDCFDVTVIDGRSHHIRPNGEKASSIFNTYGMYGLYAENMGRYQKTPDEIMNGWKNSASHNALMLKDTYTKVGIGVAANASGELYWTAVFSR